MTQTGGMIETGERGGKKRAIGKEDLSRTAGRKELVFFCWGKRGFRKP